MDATTLIGIVGAAVILLAFLLNQKGKVTAESNLYDGLNALGSLLLVVYAVLLNSIPFFILNTVWLLVSAKGLLENKENNNEKQP